MAVLTAEQHRWIDRSVLCWLSTVDADGAPSVSPKELFVVEGDRILIANVASSGSLRNVRAESRVCVAFLDVFVQKGVQAYGTARVVLKTDDAFEPLAGPLLELAGEAFPFSSLFAVDVTAARDILAPRYRQFPETTEAQQVESAMTTYGVAPLSRRL